MTAAFVLDCTGHARRLVNFDKEFDPGYQAAYGMMVEVDSHPFELDTMLFMDWRDDHTKVHNMSFCTPVIWCLTHHLTLMPQQPGTANQNVISHNFF